jgi:hypothetical protein
VVPTANILLDGLEPLRFVVFRQNQWTTNLTVPGFTSVALSLPCGDLALEKCAYKLLRVLSALRVTGNGNPFVGSACFYLQRKSPGNLANRCTNPLTNSSVFFLIFPNDFRIVAGLHAPSVTPRNFISQWQPLGPSSTSGTAGERSFNHQ